LKAFLKPLFFHFYPLSCLIFLYIFFASCSYNRIDSTYWRDRFPEKKYVRLGAIDTHYDIMGEGPPLILIHGLGWGYEMFQEVIPDLSKHFTIYAFDLRGVRLL